MVPTAEAGVAGPGGQEGEMSVADVRFGHRKGRARRLRRFAAAGVVAAAVLAPSAAFAVEYPTGGTPPSQQPSGAQVSPTSSARGSSLPFTGGDVAGLAAMGGAAALAGALLVRQSRRARVEG